MAKVAIYPGTFDPITNGHSDIVNRASTMFDKVILAIAETPEKETLFTCAERLALSQEVLCAKDNIEVVTFSGLLMDFAQHMQSQIILRGLRAVSDFEYEFQLASMNKKLDSSMETIFLAASENHTFVSASLIKEIARYGGDVSKFVHPTVYSALKQKYKID